MPSSYIGRFAPSPSGPLHFGSLLAAAGSYLDARAHGGRWYVRMEDLDPLREMPGAAADILRTLEALGLEWDGEVIYQRHRHAAYEAAVDELLASGAAFRCACSRREIADSAVRGLEGPIYPGTCRDGVISGRDARAVRLRVPHDPLEFDDLLRGPVSQDLAREVGDFVILRADGCYAYQLAVVLDDAWQGITHVVRGADLILSTPRQLWLQRLLRLPTPAYMHLPVAVTPKGEKLGKQTHAAPIDRAVAPRLLWEALQALHQNPPASLKSAATGELLAWAVAEWRSAELRTIREVIVA